MMCTVHTTHFEVAKDRQVDIWHGSIKLELMAVVIKNHLCNLRRDDLLIINRLNQTCDIVCICCMLMWPYLYLNLLWTASIVYGAFVVLSLNIFGLFGHVRQVFSNWICVLRVFSFSGKPIFSVDIHPDGTKFATGGQGEKSNPLTYIFL